MEETHAKMGEIFYNIGVTPNNTKNMRISECLNILH